MPDDRECRRVPWRGPLRKDVIGYCQEISVASGDELQVKVSCALSHFDADVVRLRHGVEVGPGVRESIHPSSASGRYPGRQQPINPGSFMEVCLPRALIPVASLSCSTWIQPTAPCHHGWQGIVSRWCEATGSGFAVLLADAGDLELWVGDGNTEPDRVRSGIPVLANQWTFVAVSVDCDSGHAVLLQRPARIWPGADSSVTLHASLASRAIGGESVPLLVAAIGGGAAPCYHFDGKIEAPRLAGKALTVAEHETQMEVATGKMPRDCLAAAWDFASGMSSRLVTDLSPNGLHGVLVNRPARAVTGHRWTGHQTDWNQAREHYAAIHFHSDDLEDAGWDTDLVVPIDDTYPSGVYAVRIRAGECEDRIPFAVRPSDSAPRVRLAVLLPTLTYQAYANSQVFGGPTAKIRQAEDDFVSRHGLLSLYDKHRDGSPVYYASRLVPNTIRPAYCAQNIGAPARLSADLCLIDWLMEQDIAHDVITDEDIHREGAALLRPYRAVVTGSHPEYATDAMWTAWQEYLDQGGSAIYLGGNGYYWVTSRDPDHHGIIEVRRGESGSRTQSALPGEYHHSSSGELGGLWRFRGRTTQSLFGVGMTAWGSGKGCGYRRLPASRDPRASFIFDGIDNNEIIGDFGLILGAAAGYEMDRLDHELGTPPHTLLLATSAGLHSPTYLPTVEEIMDMDAPKIDDAISRCVRADMVFFETGRGGAVFSTGSVAWVGSLSHNDYDNNVSTITRNVVERFASGVPFAAV